MTNIPEIKNFCFLRSAVSVADDLDFPDSVRLSGYLGKQCGKGLLPRVVALLTAGLGAYSCGVSWMEIDVN